MGFFSQLKGDFVFIRGALRALRMTTAYREEPKADLSRRHRGTGSAHGDKPALLSPRETFSYRALFERSNRYSRWALARRAGERRDRLPADAEPARIHGDLARHHARGWRHRAAEHQSHWPIAGALHRHRGAETYRRRRRACRSVRKHPPLSEVIAQGLDSRRDRWHRAADRYHCRWNIR